MEQRPVAACAGGHECRLEHAWPCAADRFRSTRESPLLSCQQPSCQLLLLSIRRLFRQLLIILFFIILSFLQVPAQAAYTRDGHRQKPQDNPP